MTAYPYTQLFFGPKLTVAIAGPHIQVFDTMYDLNPLPSSYRAPSLLTLRTGQLRASTTSFNEKEEIIAVVKSGMILCATVDQAGRNLATTAEDKHLKIWQIDGLKLLNSRYVT